ncbi:mucin-4-like [Procambarus clarkii]|uniref:mucin-4-like n=1 Tax=Procambarus clarkii TaxID=6728 RepID=UPI003743BE31
MVSVRYQQHWPQDTQLSHKQKHGEEGFDKGQFLFRDVNTDASARESAFSISTTTNRPVKTQITAAVTSVTASMNSTVEENTEVTTKANNSFYSESIPISTIPASSITSINPPILDITTTEIPVTTIISRSNFPLETTAYSINKPHVADVLEIDYSRTAMTTVPPSAEIDITNAPVMKTKVQPFTMKPREIIFKTENQKTILSLNPLPANHTENLFKHSSESADLVSPKIDCEDTCQEYIPGKEMHSSTGNTQAAITISPHINSQDKNHTDEQIINHEDLPLTSPGQENGESSHGFSLILTSQSNTSTLIEGSNTNSTFINLERIPFKLTESNMLLPSQPISNNTSPSFVTEKVPTPYVQQSNESLQPSRDIPLTPYKATVANDLKQKVNESSQAHKNVSLPPIEETIQTSLVQQMNEYSHLSDSVSVTQKSINILEVAKRPQTDKTLSTSHLPSRESLQFSNKMDNEEVLLLPITSQSTSQRVNGPSNRPLQNQVSPQRLFVPRPSLRHSFRSRITRKNHENRPSLKPQPVLMQSSQGILPQFSPASGLEFKLMKNAEAKSDSRRPIILPQFSPSSGQKFILAHPDKASYTELIINDKEKGILGLHPDPSQTVSGFSISSPLQNPHVTKETYSQREGNTHHEYDQTPQDYEKDTHLSIQNSSNLRKIIGDKISEQPSLYVTDKGNTSVSDTAQNIPATVLLGVNNVPYITTLSPISVQTFISEVAGQITQTSISLPDSHEVEGNSSLVFTTSSGFLPSTKESLKPLIQNGKNQSATFEEMRDDNIVSQLVHLKRIEFTNPKQLETNITENSESYRELDPGEGMMLQVTETSEENTNVIPSLPLVFSAMPSPTDTNNKDDSQELVTLRTLVSPIQKAIQTQQTLPTMLLNLGLPYEETSTPRLSSTRSGIESNKPHNTDESKAVSSQRQQNISSRLSHKELQLSQKPQHLPFVQLSALLLSVDSTVSPLTIPSRRQPSPFDQQTSNHSESLDTLQPKQLNEEEAYEKPSSTSMSPLPNVTTSPTAMAPEAKAYVLSSSVTGYYDKLASDILQALPDFLKGAVKVDRTNLPRDNNVVISDSYGNVAYQRSRTTFTNAENDL